MEDNTIVKSSFSATINAPAHACAKRIRSLLY